MKRYSALALFNLMVAVSSYAQYVESSLVASVSRIERKALIQNSVDVPAWHERSFWPLYQSYLDYAEGTSSLTYRALSNLANTDKTVSDQEALENARIMLSYRNDLNAVRKQAYQEIASALNGIIALQFLQTETLLDMMESSNVYEETVWKKYRFHPNALTNNQFKAAKQNTITKALDLTEEEAEKFWTVYNEYEDECTALLGEDYNMIALYAGEATDFTPALAKRMGHDFLKVLDREVKVKEKYFEKMNDAVGSSLAARFLAWEDYYSLVSKMYAWADTP